MDLVETTQQVYSNTSGSASEVPNGFPVNDIPAILVEESKVPVPEDEDNAPDQGEMCFCCYMYNFFVIVFFF